MSIELIALLMAALGFIGFRIAGDPGIALVSAALREGIAGVEIGAEWSIDKFEEHVLPWLKRIGWMIFWVLILIAIGIWALRIPEHPLAPTSAIIVVSIAAGVSAIWLFTVLRKSAFESSSFSLLFVPVLAIAFVGAVAILTGAFAHSRSLILQGTTYLLFACQIFTWIVQVLAEIGEEGTEAMRRVSDNWLFRKAAGFAVKLENASTNVYRQLVAQIAPIVIPLILIPSPITLAIVVAIGVVLHLAWTNLENEGVETASRKKQTALTLEVIAYALVPLLPYVLFVPGGEERVNEILKWCMAVLNGNERLEWKAIMVWVLMGAIALKSIYPWDEKAAAAIPRKLVAIPLVLMGAICLWNFGLRFLPKTATAASTQVTNVAAAPAPSSAATSAPIVVPSASPVVPSATPGAVPTTPPPKEKPAAVPSVDAENPLGAVLAECAKLGVPCE